MREIHRQESARPRFDPAQHQRGIGQIVNFQVRTTGAAASHRQLVSRQPEIVCRAKVDHRAGCTGVDQHNNGMSIDRARGVEVPQTAPCKRDSLVIFLAQVGIKFHRGLERAFRASRGKWRGAVLVAIDRDKQLGRQSR